MLLQRGDKWVFAGDSITDCERVRPIGEGIFGGTGKGYVALVEALLTSICPELEIRVVNMGISGNTVRDLAARWHSDVVALRPDYVSILIGINDVWRQFDQPLIRESHVYLDEYERTLRALVQETRPTVKGLVLMTPFYLEPHLDDPMRATMDAYGHVVAKIAREEGTVFVDTQKAFDGVLQQLYPAALGWDRVHPNLTGHMVIARTLLQAMGLSS